MTERSVKATLEGDDGETRNGFTLKGGMVRVHLDDL